MQKGKEETMRPTISVELMLIGFFMLFMRATALAQPAPIPHHKEPYRMDSMVHEGLEAQTASAFRQVMWVPHAAWLQIHFAEYNLGEQSFVTITSLTDGHAQRLDARSLPEWQNSTAYFNGDAVEVELHVAAGEKDIFIRIEEVTVGELVKDQRSRRPGFRPEGATPSVAVPETICGATDNRVASNEPRVGRIVPIGCTGWIVSNGVILTAGHCTRGSSPPSLAGQILQFNVPASQANGTIVNPPPQHQYPINNASVTFRDNGVGDDWAMFNTNRNANTQLLPVQAQGAFYRMSRDDNPATVRVTGYGLDGPGPSQACPSCNFGRTGPGNADSQTQQTHAGPNRGETTRGANRVSWNHQVDTQPANSGSPLIADDTTLTIGIHTHGGCTSASRPSIGSDFRGLNNSGTSFENDNLGNAIRDGQISPFDPAAVIGPGANVRYVDRDHPVNVRLRDGSVFRPFNTLIDGVNAVPAGGIVSIVTGSYSGISTINKAMTLTAPVGTVTIGR
jgi:V8-like Glu-specific endopeptidase